MEVLMFFDRGEARRQRKRSTHAVSHLASDQVPKLSMRWLVYREDNRSNRILVAANLADEAAADAKINDITARHRKPHGQEFYKHRYPAGGLRAAIDLHKLKE